MKIVIVASKALRWAVLVLCMVMNTLIIHAQVNKTCITSGDWSNPSVWSPSGVPANADRVLINAGVNLTVNGNYTCDSIYFVAGSTNATITISGTNQLTVTGGIRYSNPTANSTQLIDVGAGQLTCEGINMVNVSNGRINRINASTGTITCNGDLITAGSAAAENVINFSGNGRFLLSGAWTNTNNTYTPATSSFEYTGTSTQTLISRTYNKLILSGGLKSAPATGTITVNDSLIVRPDATLDNLLSANLTLNGVFYIQGTYTEGSTNGNVTLVGLVHITPTGTFNATVGESFVIRGGILNEGTFNSGTGTFTFGTNNQSIIGNRLMVFSGGLTVSGITLSNQDSIQVNGAFTVGTGANFINTENAYLSLRGTTSIVNLTASANGNIVEYARSNNSQSIFGTTYQTLRVINGSTKTVATNNLTVNTQLEVGSGTTLAMAALSLSLGTNATLAGTGNLTTTNTSANPLPSGRTWPFNTITYSNTTTQTIVSGTYNDLTSSAGARIFASTDTIHILGTFSPGTNAYTVTGSTVRFNRSSAQNVPAMSYNNLVIAGGSTKTVTSNTTFNVAGNLNVVSGNTLALGTIALTGATLTNSGTGVITTAATSSAIPTGRTWNSTIRYISTSAQSLITGTYNNSLELQGSGSTKTANGSITINNNLAIDPNVTMAMSTNQLLGTFTTSGSGTLSTQNTSSTPIPVNRTWSFTVNYSSSSAQTIVSGNYNNLNGTGGNRTLSGTGTIGIAGTFTPGAGTYTITNSTVEFNGAGSQTINAFTYNNLISSGDGARTLASGTITVNGNFTSGTNAYTVTGNTFILNGTAQNFGGAFNNLTLNGNNVKTANANVNVAGTLTIISNVVMDLTNSFTLGGTLSTISNNGTIRTGVATTTSSTPIPVGRTWGGTVEYTGSVSQTAVAGTYNNLTINGSGGAVAGGNITVNGILNLGTNPNNNRGVLEMTIAYGQYANVNNTNSTGIYNDLNSYVLTMGPSSSTVGSGDVTGKIRRTSINNGTTYTFGNPNTQLTFNGTALPTQITVVATRGDEGLHADKSNSVKRLYQVLRTGGNTPTTMNIRLAYDDTELNGNTEDNLILWDHHLPYGGITPHEHGKTNQNTAQNWVELSSHGVLYLATEGDAAFTKYWMISNKVSVDTTWLGAVPGGSWNIPSNWSSGVVPPTNAKIVVPDSSTTPNDPVITGTVTIGTMEIKPNGFVNGSGGTLILTGGPAINGGAGTWIDNGNFNAGNGTVIFNHDDATIAGNTTFNNLTVNNAKKVTIQNGSHIKVRGAFSNNGTLDAATNNNTIEFNGNNQTIPNPNGTIPGYRHLILSGTNPTLPSTLDVSGNLTINTSTSFTGNTLVMRGNSQQTISGTSTPTLNNVTINNAEGIITSFNPTVNGTLTFTNGKLDVAGKTLTIGGNVVNTVSGGIKAGAGTNVVVNNNVARSLSFDQTSPGNSNRINALTNNSSSQTTTIANELQVTGTVTPTSGTINANGNLVLISNAQGTARIAEGTGTYITGNVTTQRFIPAVARRWRFLSSPSTNSTVEDWRGEMFITGPGTGNTIGTTNSNGFDATQNNAAGIFWYDETLITGNSNTGWTSPANTSHVLTPGRGYRVFVRGDRSDISRITSSNGTQNQFTLNVVNPVNRGDIVMPVSYTNSGIADNDGWNLVGNPYPSAFDWDAFHDAGRSGNNGTNYTNISPTIWVLDPVDNNFKFYNALTNAGTIDGGVIAQGQAFWIKAVGTGAAMTFKETFKTANTPTEMFKTVEGGGFKIRVSRDSLNADEMIVKYISGSTTNNDYYDVVKLGTAIHISAWGNDSVLLSLSARPLTTINDTIRLYVSASSSGSYTMSFNNSQAIAILDQVLLVDKFTNTITDLKQSNTYTFNITNTNANTFGYNRFYIVVANNNALPVQMLAFNARKDNDKVKLSWATAVEKNSSHFVIEHSINGTSFTKIGEAKAKGNSLVLTQYQFTHEQPEQINYYRLKQVDLDGTFTYSPIVKVDFKEQDNTIEDPLKIYPIPAREFVTIELGDQSVIEALALYDLNGMEIIYESPNTKSYQLPLENLNIGIYLIEITDQFGTVFRRKIIKE